MKKFAVLILTTITTIAGAVLPKQEGDLPRPASPHAFKVCAEAPLIDLTPLTLSHPDNTPERPYVPPASKHPGDHHPARRHLTFSPDTKDLQEDDRPDPVSLPALLDLKAIMAVPYTPVSASKA